MRFNTLIRNYIRRDPLRHQQVYSDLISSRMGMTLAHYLETAIKISIIAGLLLALFSFWISGFIIYGPSTQGYTGLYNIFNVPVPEPGMVTRHMLGFQIAVGLVAFLLGSVVVFYLILKFPSLQKGNRRTKINLTLHNAVAYMYAMRKGGAQLMPIFRSLSDNAKVYGEIALEFRQVVRDCDFFGYDVDRKSVV